MQPATAPSGTSTIALARYEILAGAHAAVAAELVNVTSAAAGLAADKMRLESSSAADKKRHEDRVAELERAVAEAAALLEEANETIGELRRRVEDLTAELAARVEGDPVPSPRPAEAHP